ncbi:uncharacterized protein LTR77_004104 [Saxophila tyrrhenica]|uniref:Rhodopsin domain-containing protein n=1 Tax=Saxophila tyrrhenica TaxID=1690608 RepID=A0AAV9PG28_9PEZI|nr:hypothetical protein LTR77_004104 [Saxophila tyrrhenica]
MSAVPLQTAVPPGQHAPFATVSEKDRTAWILVATAMGIAFTTLSLLTRLTIRAFINRGWGWDDLMTVVATVLTWIQSILILAATTNGLGKSITLIPPLLQSRIEQLYYASSLFYVSALELSRISTVLFLRRLLAPNSPQLRYSTALLVLVPTSGFAFFLAAALQCNLSQPWAILNGQCSAPGWFLKWQVHGAFSMLFEVAIFVCPTWLVWQLQAGKELKAEVISSFAPRLITLVFTALRLTSFKASSFKRDTTLSLAPYICYTQAELAFALMAATIPTARKLMLSFITYYNGRGYSDSVSGGGIWDGSETIKSQTTRTSNGGSYQMDFLRSAANRKRAVAYAGADELGSGIGKGGSEEMIIRKETIVEIAVDEPG